MDDWLAHDGIAVVKRGPAWHVTYAGTILWIDVERSTAELYATRSGARPRRS